MLFNSHEFIFIFLPITFFVYFYLNQKRLTEASKGFLVCSSLIFYSWWNVIYLPIILISILFNFLISESLRNPCGVESNSLKKKSILIFGITLNLSLLGYFKYADFFIENMNFFIGVNIESLNLILPLAISFFTFQQIAYLVDSYKQESKEYDFLNYALFVTFFPQLIAGPIVHHKEMMPQFSQVRNRVKNYKNIAAGLFIFSIGLFKKVVIADTFAIWATNGFDVATTLNLLEAWATSLSYTFQLYFDFSGYADMAIGAALLFNIKLPINFNSPYKAINIQDFWRRWHMTLSRFLRDYVYIPLGGSKKGELRMYNNLTATFVLGGLWHGAGWTFIFWGVLHGSALIIQKLWGKINVRLPSWVSWFITFNFVNIAWIFFRAKEWNDAIKVLGSMFSLDNIVLPSNLENKLYFLTDIGIHFGKFTENIEGDYTFAWVVLALVLNLMFKNSNEKTQNLKLNYKTLLLVIIASLAGILSLHKTSEFLYFNF